MSFTNSSIKYPVSVIVGVLIAMLGGIVAFFNVPVQLTPEVNNPIITVTTNWTGASPEEIEKEIIDQQEDFLKSVEGVVKMSSQSNYGTGSITLEFTVGTTIEGALLKVTNKLNEVPSYPENANKPVVTTSGRLRGAIAWFIIKSDSDAYVPHMKKFIEDKIKPYFERVEGVSSINIFGGMDKEVHVVYDPELVASMGITITELTRALRAENRDISGGNFSEGKRRYVIRTLSRFNSLEDIRQTIVKISGGVAIRVMDIAEVSIDYRKPSALVRHKGKPAIAFNAQRELGANVIEIIENLEKQAEIVNKEILGPMGLKVENAYKQSIYINSAIDLVLTNIYLGGLLAILVLFFFLRSPSSILVIGISIPISIITTFLIMFLFGRSINVISLAGMAFAVGMVVDSAIVVLENIYRHLQMGKNRMLAAVEATKEVWGALLASTVTTVAVFLPIMFIEERAGQLFRDISIAISSAIVISLIVSLSVIPSLSARILKSSSKLSNDNNSDSFLERMTARISALVDYINISSRRRIATILSIVFVSLGLSWLLLPASEYLPNGNQNFIFSIIVPPPGYNIDEVVNIGKSVESQLKYLWETPADEAGDLPGGGVSQFFFVALPGNAFMGIRANVETRAKELVGTTNEVLFSIPGSFGFAFQSSLFSFGGGRSLQIDVTGPDLTKSLPIARKVFGQLGEVIPGSKSRPVSGLDLGNPEIRVIPDRLRAADNGMTATEIGVAVNSLVDGMKIDEYYHEGDNIDLILKGNDNWSRHTQDIAQLPIASPYGRMLTLADLAEIKMEQGPVQVNHVERQRAVSLLTNLPDNIPLEEGMNAIINKIIKPARENKEIGGLYDIKLSGTADDLSRLKKAINLNFTIAIILTYLLLAALLQSFVFPLVIMLTVPLATFGGVLGLRIVQIFNDTQQLDILTMLGFVILVGTVINNSILLVYYALNKVRQGTDPREAVKESVAVRVRPILMSTSTTALGMLPLIIMPGAGSELYRGLGSVVVGGLVLSSVITLVLTPLVFSFALELQIKIRQLLGMSPLALTNNPDVEAS